MLKKLLLITAVTVPIYAMNKKAELQEWVKKADTIQIEGLKWPFTIQITNDDTVADIKNVLKMTDNIPIDQQKLFPIIPGSNMLGAELDDAHNIKEIMNRYNTKKLQVKHK